MPTLQKDSWNARPGWYLDANKPHYHVCKTTTTTKQGEPKRKKSEGPHEEHSLWSIELSQIHYELRNMILNPYAKRHDHKQNANTNSTKKHCFFFFMSVSTSAEGLTELSHSAVSRHRGSLGTTLLDLVKGHRSPRGKLRVRGRAGSGLGWMWRGQCGQVRSGRGLVVCWG